METYVAILRGINVGGKNRLPMVELKNVLEKKGLKNVQTYIQSGNVLFRTEPTETTELSNRIRAAIFSSWEYDVPVIVLKAQELIEIISACPFRPEKEIPHLHITFLAESPEKELIEKLNSTGDLPNRFIVGKRAIYIYCPNGYSKTKLTNSFFERKLNTTATTRNMKTSLVLREMVQ